MTSSGTHTNTDNMDAHGQKLTGEITAALDKAHQASTETPIDSGALGSLCDFWAWIFEDERAAAEEMLTQLPRAMRETGENVKSAAAEFRSRDQDAADNLGRLL